MLYVKPDYYESFKCTAGKCRHNCCIGWEIDIDSATLDYYLSCDGEFGRRLRESTDTSGGDPHFILTSADRCPFLNDDNLCDIITTCGEEHLCTICREHPRFHNELPGRIESGLGACCEECARMILSKSTPFELTASGCEESPDEIVVLRDRVIELISDRSSPINDRTKNAIGLFDIDPDIRIDADMIDFFYGLERLDPVWSKYLELLKCTPSDEELESFDLYMSDRQTEYEQLLIYFIYRHLANADNIFSAGVRCAFAILSYMLIRSLGAVIYGKSGSFDFEAQVELLRMYSSEIEYSDDNFCSVLLMLENICWPKDRIVKSSCYSKPEI